MSESTIIDGRGKQPGSIKALEMARARQTAAVEPIKALFLEHLSKLWPDVAKSAKLAGWSRTQAYLERQKDETFRRSWDSIIEEQMDGVESHILTVGKERGGAGYLFPLLKAYRRDRYGDRVEHSGTIANVSVTLPQGITDKRKLHAADAKAVETSDDAS